MAVDTTLQRRTRRMHLFSYLLISVLPILICGLLLNYSSFSRQTEQQDAIAHENLELFSKTYSALLSSMDSCAGHLENNLNAFARNNWAGMDEQLASYRNNYTLFHSVMFYQKGSTVIYTENGPVPYALFEHQFRADTGVDLTMSNFFVSMNRATKNTTVRSVAAPGEHTDGEYIFYIHTLPALSARPQYTVVFCVSAHSLLSLLQDYVPTAYTYYSYSDQYLSWLFISANNSGNFLQRELDQLGARGMAHLNIGSQDYLLLRTKSDRDDTYHMLAYNCADLYAPLKQELMFDNLLILLLLLPVAVCAYVLHRRNYLPIRNLLQLELPKGEEPEEPGVANMLHSVAQRAQNMINKNEYLHEQVDEQRSLLHAQSISVLIQGADADSLTSEGLPATPAFRYPLFTMAFATTELSPESPLRRRGMQQLELPGCDLYVVTMREISHLAVLCNHTDPDRKALSDILLDSFAKLDLHPLRVGIGLSQTKADRLPVSLMQAQAAMPTAQDPLEPQLYSADDNAQTLRSYLPYAGKMLLCQCIRNGNRDIALSTLKQMYADIEPLLGDKIIQRSWRLYLYNSVVEVLHEKHLDDMLSFIPPEDSFYTPVDEFIAALTRIVGEACDMVNLQTEELLVLKQTGIISYVDEHFREPDLSLSGLCEVFSLSESYITRIFRQQVGMSFLQYVTQIRMDWVKGELAASDRPIKDIVADVGYTDIANFTRKFRQQFGLTPGQYRQNVRGN